MQDLKMQDLENDAPVSRAWKPCKPWKMTDLCISKLPLFVSTRFVLFY